MRVLREAWQINTMIHPIGLIHIEIRPITLRFLIIRDQVITVRGAFFGYLFSASAMPEGSYRYGIRQTEMDQLSAWENQAFQCR